MNYNEIVEVLDFRTLNVNRFLHMDILCLDSAHCRAALNPCCVACCVGDYAGLYYTHDVIPPSLGYVLIVHYILRCDYMESGGAIMIPAVQHENA